MTQKFQDNPTGDEDRVNPIPPRFLPFKDFAIPWRYHLFELNWVLGIPKQAGAELGQAQLELSSLTQLEEISAAIS